MEKIDRFFDDFRVGSSLVLNQMQEHHRVRCRIFFSGSGITASRHHSEWNSPHHADHYSDAREPRAVASDSGGSEHARVKLALWAAKYRHGIMLCWLPRVNQRQSNRDGMLFFFCMESDQGHDDPSLLANPLSVGARHRRGQCRPIGHHHKRPSISQVCRTERLPCAGILHKPW